METVFSCVISYLQDTTDRNSISLVCRNWFELDRLTRKHVTIHFCYATSPVRLHQRFPHLESLTVKGRPKSRLKTYVPVHWGGYATPWVNEIVTSFYYLKSVHFKRMIVNDSDLELLATKRGKQLTVLKIDECSGFTTDGLLHIGIYCNNLQTFSLKKSSIDKKDGNWLHELALRNRVIESLNFFQTNFDVFDNKDLLLIAKNCSKSLVSVRTNRCYLVDLVDFFKHAVNLEDFGCYCKLDKQLEKYVGFKFPPKLRSIAVHDMRKSEIHLILPFVHQLTELDLLYATFDASDHCLLIKNCPNLKVLYTSDVIGDKGLTYVGRKCKKLRKIKIETRGGYGEFVSHIGLSALAQGCLELEYLHVYVISISNKALKCIGDSLKNLYDFKMILLYNQGRLIDFPLNNGVRDLVKGCTKLERLCLCLPRLGELTSVSFWYIGKYGQNLRSLSLGYKGELVRGLEELKGCRNLQKLEMRGGFTRKALASFVRDVTSLRYLWVRDHQVYRASKSDSDMVTMILPFWNLELIRPEPERTGRRYQQQQPSLLGYYSLVGQRTDTPHDVIQLRPHSFLTN